MRIGRVPKDLELTVCWLERSKFSTSENAAVRKRQMSSARSFLRVASGPGSPVHMPSKRGTPAATTRGNNLKKESLPQQQRRKECGATLQRFLRMIGQFCATTTSRSHCAFQRW
jgi:hypothetical protein